MDSAAIDVITAVIVEDIMTNGNGQRAGRLNLIADDGRDLGGWNASALRWRIRRHLEPLEDVKPATPARE